MSIEKTGWDRDFGSTFEITCDGCGETEEVEGEFADAVAWCQENDWGRRMERDGWANYCPDCKDQGSRTEGRWKDGQAP